MDSNSKISIIVPIYNVERYLKRCIESIRNQTYTNIEIILVDDGSPDNCPKICDEYAKKDDRILVIHKPNGGLSDARNLGIEKATGQYITFIDSDDYITLDYIFYLYNLIVTYQADIAICNPHPVYEETGTYKVSPNPVKEKIECFDNKKALEELLYQKKFDTSAWGKLYKRHLMEMGIRFPKGKLYEDLDVVYRLLLKSEQVVISNLEKYMYLQREDSIMGRKFEVRDMDIIDIADVMYERLAKEGRALERAAKSRVLSANFYILFRIEKNSPHQKELKRVKQNIKKYRVDVLWNRKTRFKNKAAILLSYFGTPILRYVYQKL